MKSKKFDKNKAHLLITYTNVVEATLYEQEDIVGGVSIGITEIRPISTCTFFCEENIDELNIIYNMLNYLINEDFDCIGSEEHRFDMHLLFDWYRKDAYEYYRECYDPKGIEPFEEDDLDEFKQMQIKVVNYWKFLLKNNPNHEFVTDYLMDNDFNENIFNHSTINESDIEDYYVDGVEVDLLDIELIRNILSDHCKFYWKGDISALNQLNENVTMLEDVEVLTY